MKIKSGFTLIELLIVIAIIGILSSVILASLNTARAKGGDSAIKEDLDNIRDQAEIVYDGANPNSYAAVCADTKVMQGVSAAASQAYGGQAYFAAGQASDATHTVCHADPAGVAWAASAPLQSNASVFYCVDSTGYATTTPNNLASSVYVCS